MIPAHQVQDKLHGRGIMHQAVDPETADIAADSPDYQWPPGPGER